MLAALSSGHSIEGEGCVQACSHTALVAVLSRLRGEDSRGSPACQTAGRARLQQGPKGGASRPNPPE